MLKVKIRPVWMSARKGMNVKLVLGIRKQIRVRVNIRIERQLWDCG